MSKTEKNNLSTIAVMEEILRKNIEENENLENNEIGLNIDELLKQVSLKLGIDNNDAEILNEIYMELTLSGKFVYSGKGNWTIKEDNLDFWDKDGYAYGEHQITDEFHDDGEDIDFTEFILDDEDLELEEDDEDDEDDEDKEEIDEEEKEYLDVELDLTSTDDDDSEVDIDLDSDEDFEDEDDYNEIMDDYEDMYD